MHAYFPSLLLALHMQSFANDINNCGGCNKTCNATTEFCNNGTCDTIPEIPPCDEGLSQCFPSQNATGDCVVSSAVPSLRQSPSEWSSYEPAASSNLTHSQGHSIMSCGIT
jgi:hypothetical protein